MRKALTLLAVLAISLMPVSPAGSAAQSSPMPPQLPTPAEMERLQKDLEVALTKVRAAQRELDVIVGQYEAASDRLAHLRDEIVKTEARQSAIDAEMRATQGVINARAASVYRTDAIGIFNVMLSAKSYREFAIAFELFKSVTEKDAANLVRVGEMKAETDQIRSELEAQKAEQQAVLNEITRRQREMKGALTKVGREYEFVKAELEKRKSGFAFPVRAPYSYTDSWGAPRMEGTKYYHRHEGTDIFALAGTPVVSVVDGVIENLGTATLGGIKLWVRSPGDRWGYYYAHLSGYANGMANGVRVSKGQVIGYVGNTGNARGTPPHLHFETHPGGKGPVNPYPILKRVDPLAKR